MMLRLVVSLVLLVVCQGSEVPELEDLNPVEKLLNEVATTGELVDMICSCKNEVDKAVDQKPAARPADCFDILKLGETTSGFYVIYASFNETPVKVWCDMESDDGGWTVIQRRQDGLVDFDLGWEDYKHGFGFLGGEFWLGNKNIHDITNQKEYELRIETKRYDESFHVDSYNYFRIGEESNSYRLSTRTYTGHEDRCTSPLGMESGDIPDDQITASTDHGGTYPAKLARLNGDRLGWIPSPSNTNQWIQVNLGVRKLVTGVITQGRPQSADNWVTKYRVLYGDDGTNWKVVKNAAQDEDMIFNGNFDRHTPVIGPFAVPVKAQYIRIQVVEWYGAHIAMRIEILGCDGDFLAYKNNQAFSTKDSDNDDEAEAGCAAEKGAWWYGACDEFGLNGQYRTDALSNGIHWNDFQGEQSSLITTEMKIRPVPAHDGVE